MKVKLRIEKKQVVGEGEERKIFVPDVSLTMEGDSKIVEEIQNLLKEQEFDLL